MDNSLVTYTDDPDRPGWKQWAVVDRTLLNAQYDPFFVCVEGGTAIVRMEPRAGQANGLGNLHGGTILAFIDMAVFAGAHALGANGAAGGVTVDLTTQFSGGATLDRPIDARVELVRETGRLLFVRGLIVQEGVPPVASFIATLRKPSPPK
ncbi:PaaI family thioesterase [Sphingomonas immobilis]|uniref:PaaI family thioesterase n=1 Tax=Sphingomonas immobilis TaxID=3063997 RepID=A0ABT9A3H9_9SPHN|nr:PaaI family thioesterase [Sphingomonas sp. CA1-15]MDO7843292.1 PaaI family thioesterase [Sphingomonas sp. CA1-15]